MPGRILIADPVATNRIALKAILAAARYDVVAAEDAGALVDALRKNAPCLVLADAALAAPGDMSLMQYLRLAVPDLQVPVLLTTDAPDRISRLAALRDGAEEVLTKPLCEATVLARIRSLLRARDTASALVSREGAVRDLGFAEAPVPFASARRIALVHEGNPSEIFGACSAAQFGRHQISHLSHESALEAAESGTDAPDIFVIDSGDVQPGRALRLLSDLRSRGDARHAAIVLIHPAEDGQTGSMALDLGANDVIRRGVDAEELALRIDVQLRRKADADRLRAAVEERLRLAVIDPMTGLFNRRYALAHARRLAANREGKSYSVIMADVDRFKEINDTFGHAAGDAVLIEIAARLRDRIRGTDLLARVGGEEFLILMPESDPNAAARAAERLRDVVRDAPILVKSLNHSVNVTISLGVTLAAPGEDLETAMIRADGALYVAKSAGRDRVTLSAQHAA